MSSVQGLEQLLKRLEAIGDPYPVLRAAQFQTVHEAQALVHRKTGFLQRNIKPGRISKTTAQVIAATPYAAPLEFGAKPHVIRPKTKKVLAWGGERRLSGRLRSGSKPTHFATEVHHPGSRPYPYLIPGAKKAVAQINELIVKLWNRAA